MKTKLILTTCAGLITLTSAAASPFTSPSKPSAKLIINQPKVIKQLFKMSLLQIDDKNVQDRGGAVWLKPGQYDLSFSAEIDPNYTRGQLSGMRTKSIDLNQDINLTVEAGKTYYLAYDAKDTDAKKWKPVVYKTK